MNPRHQLCRGRHAAKVGADIDHIGDHENRARSPKHPAGIVHSHCGCEPLPGNHPQPRAHQLHRDHQWKRNQRDPEGGVTVRRACYGIGGNPGGIVVGCTRDQAGPENGEPFSDVPRRSVLFRFVGGRMIFCCHRTWEIRIAANADRAREGLVPPILRCGRVTCKVNRALPEVGIYSRAKSMGGAA